MSLLNGRNFKLLNESDFISNFTDDFIHIHAEKRLKKHLKCPHSPNLQAINFQQNIGYASSRFLKMAKKKKKKLGSNPDFVANFCVFIFIFQTVAYSNTYQFHKLSNIF